MTWGYGRYNCASIPALNTYADAKAHFESVVPIRGRHNPDCNKPLGKNRRFTWYRIMRRQTSRLVEGNPLGEFVTTYGAQLYGNDSNQPLTVEFHQDGRIDINLAYACPTTMNFVSFVLNGYGCLESYGGKWYWINKVDNSHFPLQFVRRYGDNTLNSFVIDGQRIVPTNPRQEVKYSVNRKAMNAVRNKYKPFLEYARNALLISNVYERLEVAEASHGLQHAVEFLSYKSRFAHPERQAKAEANRNYLFSTIEKAIDENDLGLQYELLSVLACNAGRYSYREQKYLCEAREFDAYFTNLLKVHHKDEVFKVEEMPIGKAFFDRNAVYFK